MHNYSSENKEKNTQANDQKTFTENSYVLYGTRSKCDTYGTEQMLYRVFSNLSHLF